MRSTEFVLHVFVFLILGSAAAGLVFSIPPETIANFDTWLTIATIIVYALYVVIRHLAGERKRSGL